LSKKPGFVEATFLKYFTRKAKVTSVEVLSEHFRLVTLQGEELKDHVFAVGQKTQIPIGGLSARTFTPIMWDNVLGRTKFLAFCHGDTPAVRLVNALKEGSDIAMFGPRGSLDLGSLATPALLFGDETSFGLAASLSASGAGDVAFLFEVTSVTEAKAVLAALGIANAVLVERMTGDMHLDQLESQMAQMVEARRLKQFVLTGKSVAIQRLSRALKAQGVATAAIKAKAYWAPGKTGLD